MKSLKTLINTHANTGRLEWIGIRSIRREPMDILERVEVTMAGLNGDHSSNGGKRSVTLIQHEHLSAIASFLKLKTVTPDLLRRNLVVSGINLVGLKARTFTIGTVLLQTTGICAPCSRMEEALGHGGYTAVRGHGGITASVLQPGEIKIGDRVSPA